MKKIPFSEKELEVLSVSESRFGKIINYNIPITNRENVKACYEKKPVWVVAGRACTKNFCPSVIPDNIARGFVFSGENFNNAENGGGPDMFGIPWVYVPQVGGSMVQPGNPVLKDANNWKNVIHFPDVDGWDWEGSAKVNAEFLDTDKWVVFTLLSGAWFERLISFMDFEGAALAVIDEEQQDAVKELFSATTDVLCKIVDKVKEYFPRVDAISVHDDWGSQAQPFFSKEIADELIVPYMKRLSDHIKAQGFTAELHSCGHTETRIESYIKAGWEAWTPQSMNNTEKLFQEYGDQIIITIMINLPEDLSEEQQLEEARKFVDTHCIPGKPFKVSYSSNLTVFEKELYRLSRIKYLEQ